MFFPSGGRSLFGVLHRPATGVDQRQAFVFCHPLAEEKLWAHRVFVAYARQLAAAGHPVLRFDMTGSGDSGGAFSDLSVEVAQADVRRAIEEVRRHTGQSQVSLLGLRFGATVASLVAERETGIARLILWSPIVDGDRYMQELLRINVLTQMATYKQVRQERAELVSEMEQGRTVNVDGYEMGWPLYSSVSAIRMTSGRHLYPGPCLIVQVDKQARSAPDLQLLATSYSAATISFAQEDAFWKEIPRFYQDASRLFQVTCEWLGVH